MFDHFWDFDRLVEDGAPRWSRDHGISLILWDLVDPTRVIRVYVMG
jgi:hypothetical protein